MLDVLLLISYCAAALALVFGFLALMQVRHPAPPEPENTDAFDSLVASARLFGMEPALWWPVKERPWHNQEKWAHKVRMRRACWMRLRNKFPSQSKSWLLFNAHKMADRLLAEERRRTPSPVPIVDTTDLDNTRIVRDSAIRMRRRFVLGRTAATAAAAAAAMLLLVFALPARADTCDVAKAKAAPVIHRLSIGGGWRWAIVCEQVEWQRVTQHFDVRNTGTAFTNIDTKTTYLNVRIFDELGWQDIIAHEIGHRVCMCDDETRAEREAARLERRQ